MKPVQNTTDEHFGPVYDDMDDKVLISVNLWPSVV